jgi:protein TonB
VQATVQFVPPEITDEEIPEEEVQQVVDEKTQIAVVTNEGTDDIMIPEEVVTVVEPEPEQIFTVVEQMPEFPGGEAALYKYLNSNIKYPQMEADAHIQGTVYLTFVVDKDGNIKDVKPLRGVAGGPNLEKEAMRVVKSMPSWKSGKQNGRPVSVQYNLPVRFVLK